MAKITSKLAKWLDQLGLAFRGLLLTTRQKSFWPPFIITFLFFGLLINLLTNGFSSFKLIFSGNLNLALDVIWKAFLAIFGIGKSFLDFALNLVLIVLQSCLIALVVFIYRHNKSQAEGIESSAIVAGLAVLGSGCPTCGTTLLAPVLGAILSGTSGAVAVAGKISLAINFIAIVLAIIVFKKLGFMTYAIIKSEKYFKKKENQHEENS